MNAELWAKFLELLKNHTNAACHQYINLMHCQQMTDEQWDISFFDPYTANFVEANLKEQMDETLAELGLNVAVNISVRDYDTNMGVNDANAARQSVLPFGKVERNSEEMVLSEAGFRMSSNWKQRAVSIEQSYDSGLVPEYTFDTFVKGRSNDLAYAAAQAVAAAPGVKYPLLYLYGGVGLGKTHLMHAIGNEVQRKGLRVRYMTSETFTNEFITALQTQTTAAFRARNRQNCDVLLLDDIQFIGGKEAMMEELFHTFNDFANKQRQIVITSDKRPEEIKKLEERLISRCVGGLCYDIQPPEYETRVAILKAKALRDNIMLSNDVATFIASRGESNIRDLEGTLKKLQFTAQIRQCPLSVELAAEILEPFKKAPKEKLDIEAIITRVCSYYGVQRTEVMGRGRKRTIIRPRQIIQYLAYTHCGLSYPEIAKVFERDHTTIMNSYQVIADSRKTDTALDYEIRKLEEALLH